MISFDLGCYLESIYQPQLLSLKYLLTWYYFPLPPVLAYLLYISSQTSSHLVPMLQCFTHTIGFGMLLFCLCHFCVCAR